MKMKFLITNIVWQLIGCFSYVFAQSGDVFINSYTPTFHNNTLQANTILQIADGRMCFGYKQGVMMYDGVRWTHTQTPAMVLSLAHQTKNQVFVGCRQDFGYLQHEKNGLFSYKTLSKDLKNVWDISQVILTKSKAYFYSTQRVYVVDLTTLKIEKEWTVPNQSTFAGMIALQENVYVQVKGQGLYQLTITGMDKISQTNLWGQQKIKTFIPFDANNILIGTFEHYLYLFDGKTIKPYTLESQAYLSSNLLSDALEISKDKFVLGTLSGGCLLIDKKQGKTLRVINYQTGLQDDEVLALGRDKQGGLWMAHPLGIDRADLALEVSVYSTFAGLKGNISTVFKSQTQMYVGTSQGLFYLSKPNSDAEMQEFIKKSEKIETVSQTVQIVEKGKETKLGNLINEAFGKEKKPQVNVIKKTPAQQNTQTFTSITQKLIYARQSVALLYKPILGINSKVKQIVSFAEGLLVASNTGLYEVIGTQAKVIIPNKSISFVLPAAQNKQMFYVSTAQGIYLIQRKGEIWESSLLELEESISSVAEANGKIWASGTSGIFQMQSKGKALVKVKKYNIPNPFGEKIIIRNIDNKLQVYVNENSFVLDESKNQFVLTNSKTNISGLIYTQATHTWLRMNQQWRDLHDNFLVSGINTTPLNLFEKTEDVFLDEAGYFWIVSQDRLYKVHSQLKNKKNEEQNLFISYVKDKKGNYFDLNKLKIPFQKDEIKLTLHIGSAFYLNEQNNQYQYKIKGGQWSEWTREPVIYFSFLQVGNYPLEIRSKNTFEQVSPSLHFSFSIMPPFWQTWWFYTLQTFILGGLVFATYYYNRTEKQNDLTHTLTFVTIITVFEFLVLMIEPFVDDFSGGVPIFKLVMNIILAMSLNPLERNIHNQLKIRQNRVKTVAD